MTESVASFNIPDVIEEDFNNILYVDDEDSNLRVFDSLFSRYYNVFTANSGKMAIKLLHQYDIQLIITDQKMPEMTGTDLLEQTLGDFPDVIRIILTGFADIQAIIKAINKCSIYKYVTKPYENSEIKEIIDKGLELYNMRKKKYNGSPFFSEKSNGNGASNGTDQSAPPLEVDYAFSEKVLEDITPEKSYYEMFLENAITYQYKKKQPILFKDFYIHSDEDRVKLYSLTYSLGEPKHSTMIYMHLKLKLRDLLEKGGNQTELIDIVEELEKFYRGLEGDYSLSSINLVSYDWSDGKISYLTKSPKIRIYKISHQFEEVSIPMEKNLNGYQLYSYQGQDPLMIYGWEYDLKPSGTESDTTHNLHQIVANATSLPFDMQEAQISKGIESISKDFNDFIFYGLHITD